MLENAVVAANIALRSVNPVVSSLFAGHAVGWIRGNLVTDRAMNGDSLKLTDKYFRIFKDIVVGLLAAFGIYIGLNIIPTVIALWSFCTVENYVARNIKIREANAVVSEAITKRDLYEYENALYCNDRAIALYETEGDIETGDNYAFRGDVNVSLKRFREAKEDFTKALAKGFCKGDVFGGLGTVNLILDNNEEAIRNLEKAIDSEATTEHLKKQKEASRHLLGVANSKIGNAPRARICFIDVINSEHAEYAVKEKSKEALRELGYKPEDYRRG